MNFSIRSSYVHAYQTHSLVLVITSCILVHPASLVHLVFISAEFEFLLNYLEANDSKDFDRKQITSCFYIFNI